MDHLADAPIANILILAGVIFVAVGLFGRVGGFIGSIFGNIEAGKNSRVLAGVLGVFLIVGGGWLHERGDQATAKGSSPTTTSSTARISQAVTWCPLTYSPPAEPESWTAALPFWKYKMAWAGSTVASSSRRSASAALPRV